MGAASSVSTTVSQTYTQFENLNICVPVPNCQIKTIAIIAANFPETYDSRLMQFVIKTLNIDENDDISRYRVVYFHAGMKVRPGIRWMQNAYKQIPYKYKKNLDKFYWGWVG